MKILYDENTNTVSVTVRELTDFLCRSGSIGGYGGVSLEDGKSVHKNAEDASAGNVMCEVPLEWETHVGERTLRLSGRADMIITDDNCDTIEEIKTTSSTFYGANDKIPPSHIAQAVLYAFMWCMEEKKPRAAVRITYVPKDHGDERSFECMFSSRELRAEAEMLISQYLKWAELEINRKIASRQEIRCLHFPYGDVREGQRDFMTAVVKAARKGQRVFIEAPTGIGKTMAALFPSLKALGAGYIDRIFYLTQKSSTTSAAEEASALLLRQLDSVRGVTILAKDRICPMGGASAPGMNCTPDRCECADGHYGRVTAAAEELLFTYGKGRHITSAAIAETAEKYKVCPYELSLECADFASVIICDCNYVFDPHVRLRRYFADDSEHSDEKFIFLCDEAHNLVDRQCAMYSSSLSLSDIAAAESELRGTGDEVSSDEVSSDEVSSDDVSSSEASSSLRALAVEIVKSRERCRENMREGTDGKQYGYDVSSSPYEEAVRAAEDAAAAVKKLIRYEEDAKKASKLAAIYNDIGKFAASGEYFDKRHVAFTEIEGDNVRISHLCLDASAHSDESLARARAVVMFSATLDPPDYFMRVLGCERAGSLSLPSPYERGNLCLLCSDKLSTRMQDRDATADAVADMIASVARAKVGNYICYLPSYKYLEMISGLFLKKYGGDTDIVVQKRSMNERAKAWFLDQFTPPREKSRVGFCVLGGLFSEGVDLPGDRLTGAVIVGVGLPQITAELNLRRDYYERICERGYEFAYLFPGMNKVLQAAGRVIRGYDDRGVVLLIDDRFSGGEYRDLFPDHWSHLKYVGDMRSLERMLDDFWSR